MSSPSNFLSRWSRLKREAEEKRPPDDGASGASGSEVRPAIEDQQAVLPELTPEELAALPRLEDLTPQTDLAPFMRLGVPVALRNAALRRMWTLDSAIRDRVGDALEYAYDWNTPGGVPGTGPLLASDDVQAMLRSMTSVPEAGPSAGPEAPANRQALGQAGSEQPRLPSDPHVQRPVEPAPAGLAPSEPCGPVATPAPKEPGPEEVAQARRHGGATPF
jgi:hypothetical protein